MHVGRHGRNGHPGIFQRVGGLLERPPGRQFLSGHRGRHRVSIPESRSIGSLALHLHLGRVIGSSCTCSSKWIRDTRKRVLSFSLARRRLDTEDQGIEHSRLRACVALVRRKICRRKNYWQVSAQVCTTTCSGGLARAHFKPCMLGIQSRSGRQQNGLLELELATWRSRDGRWVLTVLCGVCKHRSFLRTKP